MKNKDLILNRIGQIQISIDRTKQGIQSASISPNEAIKNLERALDVMEQLENLIEIQEDSTISAFGSDVLQENQLGNEKLFPYLVGLSALMVAGSAAFYSVYGLSKLFSGATFAVIVMAGSLEFAKLVTASFLYRFWDKINIVMRNYMLVGVVTLVIITSAGIFGFLSNAYQGATIGFQKESTKLLALEERLDNLQEEKRSLKDDLEFQLSELPDNYRTAKRKLRTDYNPQIQEVNQEVLEIKEQISNLELKLIDTGIDVGPAIYLAKIFDTDVDTVVKYFIFVLIFVFDPMAVVLVIAYNVALTNRLYQNSGPRKTEKEKTWSVYGEGFLSSLKGKIFKKDQPVTYEEKSKKSSKKIEKIKKDIIEEEKKPHKFGRDARKPSPNQL